MKSAASSATSARKLIFFVDDNITSNMEQAKEFFRALIPLKIRWVSQSSINAAHDEEFLDLLKRSGCMGVLIGFESVDERNLKSMNKRFNTMRGGFETALSNLRRHGIRVYGTFVFGYDHDTPETFARTVDFAQKQGLYIAAFNHLTPFPGTPLYARLEAENRLRFDRWWLNDEYRYNAVPFRHPTLEPEQLRELCVSSRRKFYSWPSILKRSVMGANRGNGFMFRNFFLINAMHRADVGGRDGYPLGDQGFTGPLLGATVSATVRLATAEDEPRLADLARRTAMPGRLRLARPATVKPWKDTVVAESNDKIFACGQRVRRHRYVNGRLIPTAYLTSLRVAPEARGDGRLILRGYGLLRELHERDGRPPTFTSIMADNAAALSMFAKPRRGLPRVRVPRSIPHGRRAWKDF